MRYPRSRLSDLFVSTATLVIAFTAVLIVSATGLLNMRLLSVTDNALAPMIGYGDAIVIEKVAASSLGQGDIVSYYQDSSTNARSEGRIVFTSPSRQSVEIAGNNGTLAKISSSAIIGRVNVRLAQLGSVLTFLQTVPGLIMGLYVPALIIVGFEFKRLLAYYDQLIYRLPGHANR